MFVHFKETPKMDMNEEKEFLSPRIQDIYVASKQANKKEKAYKNYLLLPYSSPTLSTLPYHTYYSLY